MSPTRMFQVRFHGRGGQGVVTAAELLSVAAFREGRWAQAFPSFGSERMGAPVAAFCRVAPRPVRTREPVTAPDVVVVGDPTLIGQVDVLAGLAPGGFLLVNTTREPAELGLGDFNGSVATVPATDLAREHVGRPVPSAALLGGLAALTGVVSLESVAAALGERFSGPVGAGNVAAATAGHRLVAAYLASDGYLESGGYLASDGYLERPVHRQSDGHLQREETADAGPA